MSRKQRSTPWAKDINELAAWTHSFLADCEDARVAQAEVDADARCAFLDDVAARVDEICDETRTHLDELTSVRADRALDEADARIRYCNAVFDWYDDFSADCRNQAAEAEKARRQEARAEVRARRAEALARRKAVGKLLAAHADDRANWWGMGAESAPSRSTSTAGSARGARSRSPKAVAAVVAGSAEASSSKGRTTRRSSRRGAAAVQRPQQLSGQDVIRSLRNRAQS